MVRLIDNVNKKYYEILTEIDKLKFREDIVKDISCGLYTGISTNIRYGNICVSSYIRQTQILQCEDLNTHNILYYHLFTNEEFTRIICPIFNQLKNEIKSDVNEFIFTHNVIFMKFNDVIYYIFPKHFGILYNLTVTTCLSEEKILLIMYELVNIIEYCHNNDIIVRNVSLTNFVFTDINLSRLKLYNIDSLSKVKYFTGKYGSRPYMCPEMFTECLYSGKKVDIYCLGVIMYAMTYKKYPEFIYTKRKKDKFSNLTFETRCTADNFVGTQSQLSIGMSYILFLFYNRKLRLYKHNLMNTLFSDKFLSIMYSMLRNRPDHRPNIYTIKQYIYEMLCESFEKKCNIKIKLT